MIGKNVATDFSATVSEPQIDPSAYVHPLASVIGNVRLGKNVMVSPAASIRGDEGQPLFVGDDSNVQDGVVIHALETELNGKPVNAFSIRKDRKDHGISKWIEGDMLPGQRAVIIDDVATTGGSTIKAIERARSEGIDVVKAVILVDRQEGGIENIRHHVDDVTAIITKDDLIRHCR